MVWNRYRYESHPDGRAFMDGVHLPKCPRDSWPDLRESGEVMRHLSQMAQLLLWRPSLPSGVTSAGCCRKLAAKEGAGRNRINAAKVAVFRLAFTELFVHFCGPKEDKWQFDCHCGIATRERLCVPLVIDRVACNPHAAQSIVI